jgi:hypothetical protein
MQSPESKITVSKINFGHTCNKIMIYCQRGEVNSSLGIKDWYISCDLPPPKVVQCKSSGEIGHLEDIT